MDCRLPRAPSPSASNRSAADAPGPPKHHVALRGVRRCRRNASHLQSGTPTVCGRLWLDPGGGREIGHFPWLSLGRFSDHVTRLLGRPGHRRSPDRRWLLLFPVLLFVSSRFRPPKYLGIHPSPRERPGNTKTGRLLGHGDVFRGGMGLLGIRSGWGWGLSLPGRRQGYGLLVPISRRRPARRRRWSRSAARVRCRIPRKQAA